MRLAVGVATLPSWSCDLEGEVEGAGSLEHHRGRQSRSIGEDDGA
jgi:hypothetical protein